MKKHPMNKRIRSSAPTENELTSPNARTRYRALVRQSRHLNMVRGAANRQGPHDGLIEFLRSLAPGDKGEYELRA